MADPTLLANAAKPPFPNVIPPEVAAAIRGGLGGDANAAPPPLPTGDAVASAEPPPQSVLDTLVSSGTTPPAPAFVSGQPHATAAPSDALGDVVGSLAGGSGAKPALAPPPKPSLGDKIRHFLPYVGAVGGALEAAAGPVGKAPVGAEMLQQSLAAHRARALKARELEEVEKPKAKAYADYMSGKNETAENVAGTRAGAAIKAKEIGVQGSKDVATINANSRQQIAALQMGAPMTISPQMAQVAGQPELAGQQLSGKSLGNFLKVFGATGAAIHDLGEEGLWAVDKLGNRIARVAVSSPSVARARAYAESRAANTPVNVVNFDENGNPIGAKAISQAEQLRTGAPSIQPALAFGKATEKVFEPAVEADTRLKQMYEQATDKTGASDMALLFNHIAMTGGNVKGLRMGQFLTDEHRKARSISEDLGVLWNHLAAGQVLSPQQRVNFVRLAENVRQTRWDAAQRQAVQLGVNQSPSADPDLPPVRSITNPTRPAQSKAQNVPGPGTQSNGAVAPEGTIVKVGNSQQIKRNGKWVPYSGQ